MKILKATLVATLLWFATYQSAFAAVLDCDSDDDAILDALAADEKFIEFTGTCVGETEIRVSGVRLQGDDATAKIDGPVIVTGATNVRLQDFGIINDSALIDEFAIAVNRGSYVDARNIISEVGAFEVFGDSGAELRDSEFTTVDGGPAVVVQRNSLIDLRSSVIEGGGPVFPAVSVKIGSTMIARNAVKITNPGGGDALHVKRGAFAELRESEYTGDVFIDIHSTIIVGNFADDKDIMIDGSIILSRDSALVNESDGNVLVTGNVRCADNESSISGDFVVTRTVSCTGFEQPGASPPPFGPPAIGLGP